MGEGEGSKDTKSHRGQQEEMHLNESWRRFTLTRRRSFLPTKEMP